jgi:RHS repeat-associated protein
VLPKSFDTSASEAVLAKTRDKAAEEEASRPIQVRYFHCDRLGTPVALSDNNGKIIWQASYDAWGNTLEEYNPDAIEQPIRFQGQHFDPESGLHYNRHRYYDPAVGSYVTQDPIGLLGGMNHYLYPTNPNDGVDPIGLFQIYGNWCGPDWTGGFTKPYGDLTPQERATVAAPVDPLDSCCRTHDIAYDTCRKQSGCGLPALAECFRSADRALSDCARNVPDTSANTEGTWRNKYQGAKPVVRDYMATSTPKTEACPK